MKRIYNVLALAGLLCAYSSSSFAQVSFSLGPRIGLNFATLSYDPDVTGAGVTKSGSIGIMIGAAAEIGFAQMFAIMVEPTYTQKGNKFEAGSAKQTISASELQFPVLFKVKFIQGPVRPYAFAGPNIGIVLSAKSKLEGTGNDGETDIKSTTSSTDFSLDFGGGAEFKAAPKVSITGDVRYSLGLSNLNSAAGSTQSIKARGFQIQFGALFHL